MYCYWHGSDFRLRRRSITATNATEPLSNLHTLPLSGHCHTVTWRHTAKQQPMGVISSKVLTILPRLHRRPVVSTSKHQERQPPVRGQQMRGVPRAPLRRWVATPAVNVGRRQVLEPAQVKDREIGEIALCTHCGTWSGRHSGSQPWLSS